MLPTPSVQTFNVSIVSSRLEFRRPDELLKDTGFDPAV
jgi:hypothetical protein